MKYDETIAAVVRQGVHSGFSYEQLMAPLIEQLAILTISSAVHTGAKRDDLLEIVRHRLDLKMVQHNG